MQSLFVPREEPVQSVRQRRRYAGMGIGDCRLVSSLRDPTSLTLLGRTAFNPTD